MYNHFDYETMTSNQFTNLSDNLLAEYLEGHCSSADMAAAIGSVSSSTDLWLLAQMSRSYSKIENEIANNMIAGHDNDALFRVSEASNGSVEFDKRNSLN